MSNTEQDPPKVDTDNSGNVSAAPESPPAPHRVKDYLTQHMARVPGFKPSHKVHENFCPLPNCSQEDLNDYRSAGVLLKAIAAELKGWSTQLPPNYYPAIIAVLQGGLQVQVSSLAQVSFDGIRIEGLLDESPCAILAHQNTIQLICHAICLDQEKQEPPHPIGFIWPDHGEKV